MAVARRLSHRVKMRAVLLAAAAAASASAAGPANDSAWKIRYGAESRQVVTTIQKIWPAQAGAKLTRGPVCPVPLTVPRGYSELQAWIPVVKFDDVPLRQRDAGDGAADGAPESARRPPSAISDHQRRCRCPRCLLRLQIFVLFILASTVKTLASQHRSKKGWRGGQKPVASLNAGSSSSRTTLIHTAEVVPSTLRNHAATPPPHSTPAVPACS